MFTGIVEELGTVLSISGIDGGQVFDDARIEISGPQVTSDVRHGDSVSVNGVCLTAVAVTNGNFSAEVMRETLQRSSLGQLNPGDRVNLERAVAAGQRLGGHIVQGHVDAVGKIRQRTSSQHWDLLRIGIPESLTRYVVEKGSIAVDGVSLTVVSVTPDEFTVGLIPTTLDQTTLGFCAVGDVVNIEVDIVAKYVENLSRPYSAGIAERGHHD